MVGRPQSRGQPVALRKESVDRNLYYGDGLTFADGSLSARRAWIEIVEFHLFASSGVVALRKESVDRNLSSRLVVGSLIMSLSARRAWIEIACKVRCFFCDCVALRKESVDRNYTETRF